ncbi:MAG: hypothetical protein M1828_005768 [Chrysothrix sp. TS-e1954]|nr:MAG: hypothetical protein M1828_005768 [Chrysothrix sp. TS-e1954]
MQQKFQETWRRASTTGKHAATFLRPRRTIVLLICAILALYLLYKVPSKSVPLESADSLLPPYDPSDTKDNIAFEHGKPKLQLLIPATSSNPELCKALLTSSILGYEAPVLINWGKIFADTNVNYNGTKLGKITGVLKYLESKQPDLDHRLVAIVDGYDTWFQLRPEVFASRYGAINRGLQDVTHVRIGPRAVEQEGLSQKIIFAADKRCGPNKGYETKVLCYAQPESPLPRYTYGLGTDVLDSEKKLPLKFRPRYLNSGFIAGPGKELLSLFRQAQSKIQLIKHNGSDQHIFNEIYGEQEYQRAVMRHRLETTRELFVNLFKRLFGMTGPSALDRNPSHIPMKWHDGHPLEFGIGLDYWLQLSHTAVLSEWDGRYLTFNGSQDEAGAESPRDLQISDDILDSAAPYEVLSKHDDQLSNTSWTDIPLYTNLWTGSIPVSMHMNGFEAMREAIWHDMWYHSRMRELLRGRSDTSEIGAFADTGEWLPWDTLCRGTEKEVFRDSLGPWSVSAEI